MYFGWLGVINDSEVTNRSATEGGALTGSPPCFLLVVCWSYRTPGSTVTHFFIAIQIRVKFLSYVCALSIFQSSLVIQAASNDTSHLLISTCLSLVAAKQALDALEQKEQVLTVYTKVDFSSCHCNGKICMLAISLSNLEFSHHS